MKNDNNDRWLHDIDPPTSDRRIVVAMFVVVCLTVTLAVVAGLGLQSAIADRFAVMVSR